MKRVLTLPHHPVPTIRLGDVVIRDGLLEVSASAIAIKTAVYSDLSELVAIRSSRH